VKIRIVSMVLVGSFLGASVAQAQISISIGDQSKRGLVKQRFDPSTEIKNLISSAIQAGERWDFSLATQKLVAARQAADRLPESRSKTEVQNSIDQAMTRISDRWAMNRDKETALANCLVAVTAALNSYQEPSRRESSLEEVIEDLGRLQEAAEDRDFDFVVEFSRDIESDLDRYGYDRQLSEAKEALRCIRQIANDRRSTSYQKMNAISDEASKAKESIRCSDTYRRQGHNHGPRQPEPRRPIEPRRPTPPKAPVRPRGPEVVIGSTDHFSKSKVETRSIAVNLKGDVVALRLKALDDIMSIESITLVLNDGRQVFLSGMVIYENDSTMVTLEDCYRLREIQIRGSSGNIFGTKAKLQVSGF